jgi:KUP system potassium uptake protein
MKDNAPTTQPLKNDDPQHGLHKLSTAALVFGALGVVFGDIGTSPLYAVKECFNPTSPHSVPASQENVIGVISLVIWAMLILVCLKYVIYVLRADNKGEGGVLAMMALASHDEGEGRRRNFMILLGIFGAALLFGDGIITPAISVLSAVEGLKDANIFGMMPVMPAGLDEAGTLFFNEVTMAHWNHQTQSIIVLITIVILIAVFSFQFMGTDRVGKFFGPVTSLWFLVLAALGLLSLCTDLPTSRLIFKAFNPQLGLHFLLDGGWHHFAILGSVVLCVTGCEALYADMGHFGARPIRIGWFSIVFPALFLNYLGQGALLLRNPEMASSPFYSLAPLWARLPLVLLATGATVIASQALITGTYSLTLSAIQMGYLPRTTICHTSENARGQIYIPLINWALMFACIGLVLAFRESTKLAAAYGIAVTMTMMLTTALLAFVSVKLWKWSLLRTALFCGLMLAVEGMFLVANGPKFIDGGWFPIAIALTMFTIMTTWKTGRRLVGEKLEAAGLSHELLIESLNRRLPMKVPGTAIFMSSSRGRTPVALLHNLKHNKILHERVIFMTLLVEDQPYVPPSRRVEVEDLGGGFWRVTGHFGFMQKPQVPRLLRNCKNHGLDVSADDSTFFLGREIIIPSATPGMARWREHLFGFASKIAQQPATYFQIPNGRVIELGQQVEI